MCPSAPPVYLHAAAWRALDTGEISHARALAQALVQRSGIATDSRVNHAVLNHRPRLPKLIVAGSNPVTRFDDR